jgi:hypothetical protein
MEAGAVLSKPFPLVEDCPGTGAMLFSSVNPRVLPYSFNSQTACPY